MSLFWFDFLRDVVPNHLITANVNDYPAPLTKYRDQLEDRSMLVKRCRMEPIECVARGYVSGSGWKDYRSTGAICGIKLPSGLRESDRLPEPIFTPASKAETGHDENISFEATVRTVGQETAILLRDLTLRIYAAAASHAQSRGIILADTKFEFGWHGDRLLLGDEVLTPDSSRYWPRDDYHPGGPQKSFDKQFVRDYLETLDWNKQPPAPPLPADVIAKTSEKYREAYRRISGRSL
jgi:phosphoribosylaminoimidazole-succinocarboxamide synthase